MEPEAVLPRLQQRMRPRPKQPVRPRPKQPVPLRSMEPVSRDSEERLLKQRFGQEKHLFRTQQRAPARLQGS